MNRKEEIKARLCARLIMSFAKELRQISGHPVEGGLDRLKDFLRQQAKTGDYRIQVDYSTVSKIIFGYECGSKTMIDAVLDRIREEGVTARIEYACRPGQNNYIIFSWA